MSILHELPKQEVWREYHKTKQERLPKRELAALTEFIENRSYENAVTAILAGENLSVPRKRLINKLGGGKRAVYTFREDENRVLKLLAYLLYRYDDRLPRGCYSFRRGLGAKNAVRNIVGTPGISRKWCYKLDIKDYFNSIPVPRLLPVLEETVGDDAPLCDFFRRLLTNGNCDEKRGVMAGTPTSPFLANVYLREADEWFAEHGVLYARYSDDIILFADSPEQLSEYRQTLLGFIEKYGLEVNPKKEITAKPSEGWEYLGVEYRNGKIDVSAATKQKLKGKIRRKARALRRWKLRKGASDDKAMAAMIRIFNRKLFGANESAETRGGEDSPLHELTWSRWFFPLVNVSGSFREIDAYLQQYIRYIPTGRHRKKNYKTSYAKLKELGYRSLVNEYYKYRKSTSSTS